MRLLPTAHTSFSDAPQMLLMDGGSQAHVLERGRVRAMERDVAGEPHVAVAVAQIASRLRPVRPGCESHVLAEPRW
jgi:hypothetical protein